MKAAIMIFEYTNSNKSKWVSWFISNTRTHFPAEEKAADGRDAEFERTREWDNGVAKTRERQTVTDKRPRVWVWEMTIRVRLIEER